MYSFSRRPDTKVIDEPFYAHYLETTGIDHPGREDTLNSMSSDINEVLETIYKTRECEVLFLKIWLTTISRWILTFLKT